MLKYNFIFVILLGVLFCRAEQVRIAVIDSGLNNPNKYSLCENVKDFTGTGVKDDIGHGTDVVSLIQKQFTSKTEYCIILYKAFEPNLKFKAILNKDFKHPYYDALEDISNRTDYDILNISAGGVDSSSVEKKLILKILSNKKIIVAAAGNESTDLTKKCNYFPACIDSNIIVVGNGVDERNKNTSSNFGIPVDIWVNGNYNGTTGTSYSTAIMSGLIGAKLYELKSTSSRISEPTN